MQHTDEKTLELSKALGKIIKTFRQNTNVSLDNFANAFGISKSTMSTIENGIFNTKFVTIWQVAEGLGLKLSELVKLLEDELGEDFKLMDE